MRYRLSTCRVHLAAVLILAAMVGASAQQRRPQDVDLQAAIRTETVDGDLNGAIKQYEAIATKYKSDRALTATALIRLAQCYQKLGDAKAQSIYEQLLREYADQKEAVSFARARLGTADSSVRAKGDRAVWTGPKVDLFGQVSPDGRYITYVDWGGDQNLMIHDLVANTDRALTATPAVRFSQFAEYSVISKDGKSVAYAWFTDKGRREVRILPLLGPAAEPRKLFAATEDIRSIAPADWSADGKWIAVNLQRQDGTGQIGLLGVADGALRVLKSVDWRGANRIAFSPDGRYLAYDLAAGESDAERHIYVMAVDGSTETDLVADRSRNTVMAWTPDGHGVLFASDRSGERGLWNQGVLNGKGQGTPTLLKRGIGTSVSLGLTQSGAMYVYKPRSANYVQVGSLDLTAAKIGLGGIKHFQRFIGAGGTPSWSNDGKTLVYKSCTEVKSRTLSCAINMASVDAGSTREVWPKLSNLGGLKLSVDGRSLLAAGRDIKGRNGVYRVDAQNAELAPIVAPRPGTVEQFSPDEKILYSAEARRSWRETFRLAQNGSSFVRTIRELHRFRSECPRMAASSHRSTGPCCTSSRPTGTRRSKSRKPRQVRRSTATAPSGPPTAGR